MTPRLIAAILGFQRALDCAEHWRTWRATGHPRHAFIAGLCTVVLAVELALAVAVLAVLVAAWDQAPARHFIAIAAAIGFAWLALGATYELAASISDDDLPSPEVVDHAEPAHAVPAPCGSEPGRR